GPLLQDEGNDLLGDEIRQSEERRADDHEPDDDSGGLHHLTAIGPLYSLQLAPASLQEGDQPAEDPAPRGLGVSRSGRRRLGGSTGTAAADPGATAPAATVLDRLLDLGLELLLVGLLVRLGRSPGRELRLGEFHVGRGVLEWVRSAVVRGLQRR